MPIGAGDQFNPCRSARPRAPVYSAPASGQSRSNSATQWPWGVRAGLRHPVIKRLARAALPESELAALPPEENAELLKRLAEEIRKAAADYQRKMGLFIEPPERPFHRRILKVGRTAEARLRLTFARRQNQSQLVSASSNRSCVASKLLRDRWRTCLQLREFDQEFDLIFGPNTRLCGLRCHRSLLRIESK